MSKVQALGGAGVANLCAGPPQVDLQEAAQDGRLAQALRPALA